MMNYDELRRRKLDIEMRGPPWASVPGQFLCQLTPSGAVDPRMADFTGMMAAIVASRELWVSYKGTHRLRVTRSDGSEMFLGSL